MLNEGGCRDRSLFLLVGDYRARIYATFCIDALTEYARIAR